MTTSMGATDLGDGRCGAVLTFQRLDVYQRALQFLSLVKDVIDQLPKGNAERGDQIGRAAESVIRNIAEGAGRWSRADSAKHYKIARGEAMECAASLDVLKLRETGCRSRSRSKLHVKVQVAVNAQV